MKDQLIKLLEDNNIIPVNDGNWSYFELEHIQPNDIEERNKMKKYVYEKTKKSNGLYYYADKDDNCLYIGKGKPIRGRLYSHYCESFELVKGDRSGKWHRFFKKNQGTLKIYWLELEDEDIRVIVEKLLCSIYKPSFERFEK